MRIRSITHFVTAAFFLSLGAGRVCADVELGVVSASAARPHFVAAGLATTFVVSARNTAILPVTVSMKIQSSVGPSGDWQALLFAADPLFRPVGSGSDELVVTIPARQAVRLVARLGAGSQLAEGAEGGAVVSAWLQGSLRGRLELRGRVRNRPKVYYVAIDGCGRGYLDLNRQGTRFDGTGERLMPHAAAFVSRGARMASASSILPAVTDPNHAAALTGSWAGTLGICSVRNQYLGRDAAGNGLTPVGSRGLLRWGPDGQRVQSIFDVAKDPASGGTASAFNAIVTGKDWLAELFRDGAVDLAVDGKDYPDYIPAPQRYRLGDPPSDDDADQDREGTNLGGRLIKHLFSTEAMVVGDLPQSFPEDRWIGEAVVRVIQAEDPDVLYVDLGDADSTQHVFGAADHPEEWIDPGTPSILWDDENIYNPKANRDPVLDVVHEADWDFGLIADTLESRQTLDRSFVVLLSDHGLDTVMNTPATELNPGRILLDGGVSESEVEWIANRGEWGFLALTDQAKRSRIEAILEAYELFDPVQGTMVKPFIVINREEMDSGVDGVEGRFAEDGVPGNRHGELYSEWSIDFPVTDNSKVRWPDLIFFTRNHFQTLLSDSTLAATSWVGSPFHGNHGSRRTADVILVASGPGIRPGIYAGAASLADIAPTLYRLLGVNAPGNVDGRVLDEILSH
jgi:predicted AlkP superfamily pyrophosphatase or phosphodiesterase